MRTIFENWVAKTLVVPVAITASGNTTGVDMLGLKKDVTVVVQIGAVSGTTPTDVINIQTSPDNSAWTTQATINLATGSANKVASTYVRAPPSHRYIRLSETVAGTTPSFLRSAVALIRAERGDDTLNSATPA